MSPGGQAGVELGLGLGGEGCRGCDVGDTNHGLVLRVPVDNGV